MIDVRIRLKSIVATVEIVDATGLWIADGMVVVDRVGERRHYPLGDIIEIIETRWEAREQRITALGVCVQHT